MDIVPTISAVRQRVAEARSAGRRIALVPTMGALHEGHLALVDAARRHAELVVMSIFVNPLQFLPGEDLARYPRPLKRDAALAASRGVDLLFTPDVEEMYRHGHDVRIVPGEAALRWEGAHRPGHFDGVLTVVAKLFHIVAPDVACFGRKDIQQVTVVRQMIDQLDMPVELVVVPTVRDRDGLALSSRNSFLSAADRLRALALSEALTVVREAWGAGERDADALRTAAARVLERDPAVVTDYIALADPVRLAPVTRAESGTVVAVAARVGTTRLIDNIVLGDVTD